MGGERKLALPKFPEEFLISVESLLASAAKHKVCVFGGAVLIESQGLMSFSNLADSQHSLPELLRAMANATEERREAGLVVDKQVPRVV